MLLVEPDEMTREFLRGILEEGGSIVSACSGADEAFEQLEAFQPHAMLASYAGSDDDSLTTRLRAQPSLAFLPLLLLSSDASDITRFEAIGQGADEFLVKPVDPPVLLAAIRNRISRARMLHRPIPLPVEPVIRGGQLRRGEFLTQLGGVLRGAPGPWQVLMALRLDQGQQMADLLGQAASFELEQALAARFSEALREDDAYTLWMEFGFGVLAERESRAEIEVLAREICERVAQAPLVVRGTEYVLTLSVGIALAPAGTDTGDPDRWFASAYAAQAIAHRVGGNRFDGVLTRDHGSMPPERVLIIREWAKEALSGDNVLIEFQPILPLQMELAGLYSLDAKLRDYRAPLAGVKRKDYLSLAREAGSLPMIDRMSLFSAFEAIEEERANGRATRVMVPVDLAAITDAQMLWLDAELRRHQTSSDGLIIEFDADVALGRPELATIVQRLEDHGIVIAISDSSGRLDRMSELLRFPANLMRLPLSAIDSLPPEQFRELLEPWHASGRGLIADQVESVVHVSRLWNLNIGYIQGDALAAGGLRLDYEFSQFGL